MKSAMQVFAVAFVTVVIISGTTTALHCQHCLFEGCDDQQGGERIECSMPTVNRLYKHLEALANLEGLVSATPSTQKFQCFQVVISDGSKNGTIKSCAFAQSDICNAWRPGISVQSCKVCQVEDHCGDSVAAAPPSYAHHSAAAGLPAAGWLHWIVALPALVIALKIGSIKL